MYIFKNALTSINRNKGRNILIGIIIVVIAGASTIALAIRNSANTIVMAYKEANPLIATLSTNREKVMELFKGGSDNKESNITAFNSIPVITLEEINEYGNSEYLSSYYYTYTISLDSDTLDKATDSVSKEVTMTESKTTTKGSSSNRPGMPNDFTKRNTTTIITKSTEIFQNSKIQTGDFSLIGYSSYNAMQDFISGNYTITSGALFTNFDSYECVINQELATLNELQVGDTITLKNSNNSKKYVFTITGIYEESSEATSMVSMYSNSANTIITSVNIVEQIMADDSSLTSSIEPSFILNSENDIENFAEEVKEKGLSEYYEVTTNLEDIESETESISNVKTFATTFLVITLIIGGIVLFVINMINVRERKYEIGVLRTIGMKKSLVISQFVIELLVVSLVSLTIGAIGGSFASVKTANYLLSNEIASSTEKMNSINNNFGGKMNKESNNDVLTPSVYANSNMGIANVSKVNNLNAVVNIMVIMELLGIGILLTLISSLAAMISISRFSPLTILKERS